MKAGDVVDEARDYHHSFGWNAVSQKMAMRRLSAAQRSLARTITALSEEALAEVYPVRAPEILQALVTGEGIPLDSAHSTVLKPARAVIRGAEVPCEVLGYTELEDAWRFPAVWLAGGRVHPVDMRSRGDCSHGWDGVTELRLLVVPTPPELADDDAELTLPEQAKDALVMDLVVFMAGRTGALKEMPHVIDLARDAHASAVETIAASSRSATWRVNTR